MSVRTNWHLDSLEAAVEEGEAMQQIQQLKSQGKIIDLSRSSADIQVDIEATIEQEARFARSGLECDLKWSPEHSLVHQGAPLSCFNCLRAADPSKDARGLLCALGRRQTDLNDELRAVVGAESLDQELIAAFERDAEACAELAEAMLAA